MSHSVSETELVVERLHPEQIRVVYPLIRVADPSVSLRDWVRYAGRLANQQTSTRGVLVARRRTHRHPCGAVCYRLERHISRHALLAVENLVSVDFLHPERIAAALIDGIGEVAIRLGCERLRVTVSGNDVQILRALLEAGHRHEGVTLSHTASRVRPAGEV